MSRLVVVAGPTCSGKSALAMALAERLDGVVVNADAMQCYRELRILTARPSEADEARVPHALYGVRAAAEPVTVAWWCAQVAGVIAACAPRVPILCGGTLMYVDALLHGLSEMPDPGPAARLEARTMLAALGAPGLHARLAAVDPDGAGRLQPADGQRIARAWEVWRGTGRTLGDWQARPKAAPRYDARAVLLDPDRAALRAAIGARWQAMIAQGAMDEVAALRRAGPDGAALPPDMPAMRAHGVPELCAVLDGRLDLAAAGARAVTAIGQYTKRQATWARHHTIVDSSDTFTINARFVASEQLSLSFLADTLDFLARSH